MSKITQPFIKVWKNPRSRRLLFVSAGVLAILGFAVFGGGSSGEEASAGRAERAPDMPSVPGGEVHMNNPHYQDTVTEANRQRAQTARQSGGSAMATVDVPPTPPEPVLPPERQAAPPEPVRAAREEAPRRNEAERAKTERLRARMQAQMTALTEAWRPSTATVVVVSKAGGGEGGGDDTAATSGGAGGDTGGDAAPGGMVVVRAGHMAYARVLLKMDSDVPGTPATARIMSGPLKGYTAFGTFERVGERLVVQIDRISGPLGTLSVSAYMIDPEAQEVGIYDNVDPRVIERVGLQLASSFITGYAAAQAAAASTTILNPLGGTTTTTDEPTDEQTLWSGIERGAETLGVEVDRMASEMTMRVEKMPGSDVGIFFTGDVVAGS